MLFCITANYTPQALNALMDNPNTSRLEAVDKLVTAAGGKVVALYSTSSDGPGAMLIFDADGDAASAISGVITASGSVTNVKLSRLRSHEEIGAVRHKAAQIRGSYRPAGQ